MVDTHLYLMEYTHRTGDQHLSGYLSHIKNEFRRTVQEMSQQFPLIVGEWCLEPMSPKAAVLTGKERLTFYRSLADTQLTAWDSAAGWFFWNYKLLINGSNLDGWDLGKSIELRYLPEISPQKRSGKRFGEPLLLPRFRRI